MKDIGEKLIKITLALLLSLGLGLQLNCSAEELAALQGEEEEEEDPLDQLIQEWLLYELFDIGNGACNVQQGLLLETLIAQYIAEGGSPSEDSPTGDSPSEDYNPHYDPIGDQPLHGMGEEVVVYRPNSYGAERLVVNDYHGAYLSQSDILISKDEVFLHQDEAEHAYHSIGIKTSTYRWPQGSDGNIQVPYVISSSLPAETVGEINQAIAHWQERSRFRFVQRSSETDYLSFEDNSSGCNSYVGRQGGSQTINLAPNCGFGAAVHEIGHALGLWHEQTRLDRDNYIIYYSSRTSNTDQYTVRTSDGADIGSYDYESIMHYGSFYFATGSDPVMTKKDGSIIEPNRRALTDCDVVGAEELHFNSSAYN